MISVVRRSCDGHMTKCIFLSHCSNNESVVQEVRALEEQAFTLPKFILKKVQELMREIIGELVCNPGCVHGGCVRVWTGYSELSSHYLYPQSVLYSPSLMKVAVSSPKHLNYCEM